MKPWFESDIQRLELEQKDLESLNVSYEIDEGAKAINLLRVKLFIAGDNPNFNLGSKYESLELVAVFPDTYPFFRPSVYSRDISLPRHQNPLDGGLCLLGRPTELWDPQWTLAKFLQKQLSILLVQGEKTNLEELSLDETEQAEPQSEYYSTNAIVIFDPSKIASKDSTVPVELIGKTRVGFPAEDLSGSRLAVLEISNLKKELISSLPEKFCTIFSEKIHGVLYRVSKLPYIENPNEMYNWLKGELKGQKQQIYFHGVERKISGDRAIKNIIGLNFPEEVAAGKLQFTGWLFLIVGDLYKSTSIGKPKVRHHFSYFGKANRIVSPDANTRAPKLQGLSTKKVVVIGLGSLGAPSAIEFARNGVGNLTLLDYDIIDAETTVRYPIGISYAGVPKIVALKHFIEQNYPYTSVDIIQLKIGQVRGSGHTPANKLLPFELEEIEKAFDRTDLIYDASAEQGVTHYFAEEARLRKIAFVCISGTQGALGGQILRIVPGKTEGCWMCSMWHQYQGAIPKPPADESGKVQARGCGDITFTGVSFDLQNISLAGVRLAVSILCEGNPEGYPSFDWDIGILSLVDDQGKPILPQWKQYKLQKHQSCPYCEKKI